MASKKVQAIILAAGASTRMKTEASKLLHPVLGKTLIHWAILKASWIADEIILVTGHQKEAVEAEAKAIDLKVPLHFAHQKDPKGTADAVRSAMSFVDDRASIFITGGDSILLQQETLLSWKNRFDQENAVLSFLTFDCDIEHSYGRVIRNATGVPLKIVEAKEANSDELLVREVNAGFYLCKGDLLRSALLDVQNKNLSREFYLTDIVDLCRAKSLLVTAQKIPAEESFGVNNLEELSIVENCLRSRILKHWMSQGIRIRDQHSTWIDADVDLQANVVIEPGVILKGSTRIQNGAHIGPYSVLENMSVGPRVEIEAFSHLKDSVIESDSTVGPFARLRPGTHLKESVHVGNFVEIKKSTLEKNAKAGHLSYIGDAEIGPNCNIGAGTITCNYDGFKKHKTILESDVFVGSNSSLVAPVKIGKGAIIGAGTVVTKNVSEDSLALSREPQIEKADWAKIFRNKNRK